MSRFVNADTIIKKKIINLENLSSRLLSNYQVIVETDRKKNRFVILTIPKSFKNNRFLQTLIYGFTLPWVAIELGQSARSELIHCTQLLFDFLIENEKNLNKSSRNITKDILTLWGEDLIKQGAKHKIWLTLNETLKLFTKTLEHKFGKTSNWPTELKDAWNILRSITPKKPKHKKLPPLGIFLGIPPEKFSNRELLMGLRYGSIWLLKTFAKIRNELLEEKRIKYFHEKIYGLTSEAMRDVFNEMGSQFNKSTKCMDENSLSYMSGIWTIIRDNPLMSEWQFYSKSNLAKTLELPPEEHLSKELYKVLISRCINEKNVVRSTMHPSSLKDPDWALIKQHCGTGRSSNSVSMPCMWKDQILTHTRIEKLLMVWLLASERIQKSGIENLLLSSVSYSNNNRSLQIISIKERRLVTKSSAVSALNVKSPIYKKSDPPFNAYNQWLETEEFSKRQISGHNPNNLFITDIGNAITGTLIISKTETPTQLLPLELLCTESSNWQRAFLEATPSAGQREALAFIEILKELFKRIKTKPGTAVTLSVSPIGQSLIVEQQRRSFRDNRFQVIEAESVGHSIAVSKNIYQKGFQTLGVAEIVDPVNEFARTVGDEKYKLALAISHEMIKNSQKLSLKKLYKFAGIGSELFDHQDLISKLSEKDMLSISGEIEHQGKIYIVESDMTAAIMFSYISYIEQHIPKLVTSSRNEKTISILARLIYLHQAFMKFSTTIQSEAINLAKKLDIAYPPLD